MIYVMASSSSSSSIGPRVTAAGTGGKYIQMKGGESKDSNTRIDKIWLRPGDVDSAFWEQETRARYMDARTRGEGGCLDMWARRLVVKLHLLVAQDTLERVVTQCRPCSLLPGSRCLPPRGRGKPTCALQRAAASRSFGPALVGRRIYAESWTSSGSCQEQGNADESCALKAVLMRCLPASSRGRDRLAIFKMRPASYNMPLFRLLSAASPWSQSSGADGGRFPLFPYPPGQATEG